MNEKEGGLERLLEQHGAHFNHGGSHHAVQHILMITVAVLFGVFLMMNLQQTPTIHLQGFAIKVPGEMSGTAVKQSSSLTITTTKVSTPSWIQIIRAHPQLPYLKVLFYTLWVVVVGVASAGFIEHKRQKGKHP